MIEIVFAALAASIIFLIVIGLAFLSRLYRRLGTAALGLAVTLFLTMMYMAYHLPNCFRGPAPWWCSAT